MSTKAQKITVKLPWEISTTYSEILQGLSDDEEDDDDLEAHEASVSRLRVRLVEYKGVRVIGADTLPTGSRRSDSAHDA